MTLENYVSILEEYFALIENCRSFPKYRFFNECARLLPVIYSASLDLPKTEGGDEEIEIDESKLAKPMADIGNLLGEQDAYHEVFDPLIDEYSLITVISDDLSDIYLDLKSGYLKYIKGTDESISQAIWDWRFSLQHHFGDHLVDVMRPIHRLIMA